MNWMNMQMTSKFDVICFRFYTFLIRTETSPYIPVGEFVIQGERIMFLLCGYEEIINLSKWVFE